MTRSKTRLCFLGALGLAVGALLSAVILQAPRIRLAYHLRLLRTAPSWRMRANSAIVLGRIGEGDAVVRAGLEQAMLDPEESVRDNARWALREVTGLAYGSEDVDRWIDAARYGIGAPFPDLPPAAPNTAVGPAQAPPVVRVVEDLLLLGSDTMLTVQVDGLSPSDTTSAEGYRATWWNALGVSEVVEVSGRFPYRPILRIDRRDYWDRHCWSRRLDQPLPPGVEEWTDSWPIWGGEDPRVHFVRLVAGVGSDQGGRFFPWAEVRAYAVRPEMGFPDARAAACLMDGLDRMGLRITAIRRMWVTGYTWNTNTDGAGTIGADATASGRPALVGTDRPEDPRTLAADPARLPAGTLCYVVGMGWGRVDDVCGAAIRDRREGAELPRLDAYLGRFATTSEAETVEQQATAVRYVIETAPATDPGFIED